MPDPGHSFELRLSAQGGDLFETSF